MKFEEALLKLNEIVEKLDGGELTLEDSVKLYKEGIDLSAQCKKQIEDAKLKVNEYNEMK